MESKKFLLQEKDIPTAWYNIVADMENKPLPPLNPKTKEPLKPEDLYPLFAKGLVDQEMNQTDAWIEIPEEVREMYKIWRPTPLVRAYGLEKALDTPAHIYFKNESVSPVGSHKLNSAIPQAYFCKKEGVTNVTTETGAGQGELPWLGGQTFRIGTGCLYGKGQLQPETLPPFYHADVRSRSDRLAQYEYTCRPRHYHQAPELSGKPGNGYLRSGRVGYANPQLQICIG